MPILYACLVSKRRTIITQANGTKLQGNFNQEVLEHVAEFETWGKQSIHLTSETKLVYADQKDYAFALVCHSYDIKDIEAHRYLDALQE